LPADISTRFTDDDILSFGRAEFVHEYDRHIISTVPGTDLAILLIFKLERPHFTV
jgi:hypothetical protein